MIKILKNGIIPPTPYYKAKCKNCKCQYLYQEEDEKWNHTINLDDAYLFTICPTCGKRVRVHYSKKYFLKEE